MRDHWFLGVVAAGLVAACGWPVGAADAEKPARLLVVSVTTGFRHASIGTAEPVLEELGRSTGLFHCDFLRMPPGRLPQPKAPTRGDGESDDEWKRREAGFKEEQEMEKNIVYSYKRENHFNEWISQFQAKESTSVPKEVIDQLRAEFRKQKLKELSEITHEKVKGLLKKLKFTILHMKHFQ